MVLELRKASPVRLHSLDLDERWLQDRIADDPSLLGLGDLQMLRRERNQPTGGRIDFLMYDPDRETRYEIEIRLGTLDESHIIRDMSPIIWARRNVRAQWTTTAVQATHA